MLKLILIGGASLAIIAFIIFILMRRSGTVYLTGNAGFVAFTSGQKPIHQVTEAQLRQVVQRLLRGDLVDMLWISRRNDEYTGIIVDTFSGPPTLSLSFKTISEQSKLKKFKAKMSALGYRVVENSGGYSGGETEEFRITTLDYTLPKSADAILAAVKAALDELQPSEHDGYFLTGSNFQKDGPGKGPGIRFRPSTDPLKEIL